MQIVLVVFDELILNTQKVINIPGTRHIGIKWTGIDFSSFLNPGDVLQVGHYSAHDQDAHSSVKIIQKRLNMNGELIVCCMCSHNTYQGMLTYFKETDENNNTV